MGHVNKLQWSTIKKNLKAYKFLVVEMAQSVKQAGFKSEDRLMLFYVQTCCQSIFALQWAPSYSV